MRLQHTVVYRRSMRLIGEARRAVRRAVSGPDSYRRRPPVLVNSFPKSGTHLLLQIAEALPGTESFGSFLASQPTFPFVERGAATHRRLLRRIAPGEIVAAHLFHAPAHAEELRRLNALHLFIYRDLRDVAVSEAHYLATMTRWHGMHRYFSRLPDTAARVMAAIRGVPAAECGHDYPDIGARFRRYQPWLADPAVVSVRYEDLMSPRRDAEIERIVDAFARCGATVDRAAALAAVAAGIDPQRSRTFREGRTGGWRAVFTREHVAAMQEVAGPLLVTLGYESDLSWQR